ncbi:MAG: hypothetical protein Q9203_000270 [Teloschistes exilis]
MSEGKQPAPAWDERGKGRSGRRQLNEGGWALLIVYCLDTAYGIRMFQRFSVGWLDE